MRTEAQINSNSIAPLNRLMGNITDGNRRNAIAACRLRGVIESIRDLQGKAPDRRACALAQINERLLKITEDLMAG
jgi:hypothetical protein